MCLCGNRGSLSEAGIRGDDPPPPRRTGGGGGAAQLTPGNSQGQAGSTDGGNGGAGEIKFRFIRKNA